MTLAATIKAARVGRYSQTEVAMILGLSQPSYSNIENGITEPSATTLFTLCRVLGIDLSPFIARVDVLPYLTQVTQHRADKAQRAQRRRYEEG